MVSFPKDMGIRMAMKTSFAKWYLSITLQEPMKGTVTVTVVVRDEARRSREQG